MDKLSLLIIDDDKLFTGNMRDLLIEKYQVETVNDPEEAETIIKKKKFEIILLDIKLGSSNRTGIYLLTKIKELDEDTHVIMVSAHDNYSSITQSTNLGASDFLSKSYDWEEMVGRIDLIGEAIRLKNESKSLKLILDEFQRGFEIVTKDKRIIKALGDLKQINGNNNLNILIEGESGTGKELMARYANSASANGKHRPFVAVNCTAIPGELLESTLFGHVRGSFTGADRDHPGKFELANGGDIFLDEIGVINLDLQSKLLRVLQEKVFERIGSNRTLQANFRVIAATNEDLDDLVAKGKFRLDLFYRLNGYRLRLPSLKERASDIDMLVKHFLKGKTLKISEEARKVLNRYSWPGNIRELQSLLEMITTLKKGGTIVPADIPSNVRNGDGRARRNKGADVKMVVNELIEVVKEEGIDATLKKVERWIMEYILETSKNQVACAKLLKVSDSRLTRKIQHYGIYS